MNTHQQPTHRLVFVDDLVHHINQEVTKLHQHIQTSVIFEAQSYSNKGLPAPDESSIEPYLTGLIGQYMALKKDVSLKLQGGLQKLFGMASITAMNEKINAVKDAIVKEINSINNLETDKSRMNISTNHTAYKKYAWLLFLFAIAECLLTMSCFLKIGDIVIIALVLGTVIGLAQIYAAKTTTLFIREINEPRKRKSYYRLALIGFTVFSLFLGALRFYFAHQGAAAGIPIIILNPFSFAALNMLLVIASALLVHFYFPSKYEMQELEQVDGINKKINLCAKRKRELELQHEHLLKERVQAIKVHGALAHSEQELFQKIDAFFDEAVGKFKHENVIKRADGTFPICFKQPHVPLPGSPNKPLLVTDK